MNFSYEIDIEIDELTDCLVERKTGQKYKTEYFIHSAPITIQKARQLQLNGWKFDWSIPQKDGFEIYELKICGDTKVQGMIALRHHCKDCYTEIGIIESAPENLGHFGLYKGVGGNLFAIACKLSFEVGNDGYVRFIAKTDLIEYYQKKMFAQKIGNQSMIIDTEGALKLIQKYFQE